MGNWKEKLARMDRSGLKRGIDNRKEGAYHNPRRDFRIARERIAQEEVFSGYRENLRTSYASGLEDPLYEAAQETLQGFQSRGKEYTKALDLLEKKIHTRGWTPFHPAELAMLQLQWSMATDVRVKEALTVAASWEEQWDMEIDGCKPSDLLAEW